MGKAYEPDDELTPEELSGWLPAESRSRAERDQLQHDLEVLRDRCACLSRDLEDVRAELTQFRIRYHAALGQVYVELERVQLRVQRLRTALEIVARTPKLPQPDLEEWIAMRTQGQRETVERLEREIEDDAKRDEQAERQRDVTPDEQRLLRRLYRKLAIRFHPDLQTDPGAKKTCERMMARIAELYRARDLEGLELIAEQEGDLVKAVLLEPDEYHAWLESRVERLRRRVEQLEQEIEELWSGDLAVLLRRHRDAEHAGRDLFNEMVGEARAAMEGHAAELRELDRQLASLPDDARERVRRIFEEQ